MFESVVGVLISGMAPYGRIVVGPNELSQFASLTYKESPFVSQEVVLKGIWFGYGETDKMVIAQKLPYPLHKTAKPLSSR